MVLRSLCVVLALGLLLPALRADDEPKADLKKLEATMDKALKAYNEGDHKKFFADYAKAMRAIATEQTFNALYKEGAMKQFGKCKEKPARKFLEKQSALTGEAILACWQAEFEKNKKVKISANFMKEGDAYKLMQIQFEELKDDDQ